MKTLDDLTPEIRERIPQWKNKCTDELYSGVEYQKWKREYTVEYMNYVYKLCERPTPIVVIANTLTEYRRFYNVIFNEKINKGMEELVVGYFNTSRTDEEIYAYSEEFENKVRNLALNNDNKLSEKHLNSSPNYHWISITSEYSRVYLTWYKFIKDEFKLECTKAEELDKLYSMVNNASIAKVYVCENIVLVLRMPSKIIRNDIGLHNTANAEGAIQYPGEAYHYINGRRMPDWVFNKYFTKTLTFEDFVNEDNEDIKGGIIILIKDNEGNEGLMKFLQAYVVDEQELVHENGHKEIVRLYKTKQKYSFLQDHLGNTNVPYSWTYMKCPSTGTEYLIDTSSAFDNVIDSVKFHRPQLVPMDMDYKWLSFTN
jgi:hypothetical protein